MPQTHRRLRFPGTIAGLERAEADLRLLLAARDLNGQTRYNVELAFEEVAANIVRYGATTREIEVSVAFDAAGTTLVFEDDGLPFDPTAQVDPSLPTSLDDAAVGGLGVMLVRSVAASMIYERTPDDRNRLTLTIPSRS